MYSYTTGLSNLQVSAIYPFAIFFSGTMEQGMQISTSTQRRVTTLILGIPLSVVFPIFSLWAAPVIPFFFTGSLLSVQNI